MLTTGTIHLGLKDCDSGEENSDVPPTDNKLQSFLNSNADVVDWTRLVSVPASWVTPTSVSPAASPEPQSVHSTLKVQVTLKSQSYSGPLLATQ